MAGAPQHQTEKPEQQTENIWISQPQGLSNCYSDANGRFAIIAAGSTDAHEYLKLDAYSAAKAFIDGKYAIRGDVFAAIRFFLGQPHDKFRAALFTVLARLERVRIGLFAGRRRKAKRDIGFHYNRSNEFYRQFLDSHMMYSAAHFGDPAMSLEDAQREKLDRICQDLRLRRGDRFLDVGCGWGGLVVHAAENFGVNAFGCTLAREQLEAARQSVETRGLAGRVTVDLRDYRDLKGQFDKIASVGMFEHVGRKRLRGYFETVHRLLEKDGLFLNRGVVRPPGGHDGPDTFFIQKHVFPGGELVHLHDVVREGERAGFEVIGIEDLRLHYALTCREWVKNLERNVEACKSIAGERTYRTWLLYLAASAVGFEEDRISCAQVLFAKR
ncbi:MAG: class I SAM-dependent methyltransferase [Bryobacteraceae bacterium]